MSGPDGGAPDEAGVREPGARGARARRRGFPLVWLVPVAAVLVAGYLGYTTLEDHGPLVTLTFGNADGLTAGQTAVRYKSVQVGTVESIRLTEDLSRVRARVRMTREVEDRLTDRARFWVVRPRLTAGNITGLDTIVSGSYVEFDPGRQGGDGKRDFDGLDDPPGIRSDEPGRVFTLRAGRIGSLDRGSPVFFRDVAVGQILGFDPPGLDGEVMLRAFVRSPYDRYLREASRFWNTSGVDLGIGPQGVRLEFSSVRALLAGGVAFDTPPDLRDAPPVGDSASFELYDDRDAAAAATSPDRVEFLTYFEGSVRGLATGAPVEMRGLRVGSISDVQLQFDRNDDSFRVLVRLAVEPTRIAHPAGRPQGETRALAERMVAGGVRAQLRSGNLLTGQMVLTLDAVPDAPPATVRMEGDQIVLPSLERGGGDVMTAVGAVAAKLESFPIEQIGRNLNDALASVSGLAGGPEMRDAARSLSAALGQVQDLVRKADGGLTPLLRRLPAIAANLEGAIGRANAAVGSIENGYGRGSDFNRDLERLMDQATDAARSVRVLADYLDRHPEALVRGRVGAAGR